MPLRFRAQCMVGIFESCAKQSADEAARRSDVQSTAFDSACPCQPLRQAPSPAGRQCLHAPPGHGIAMHTKTTPAGGLHRPGLHRPDRLARVRARHACVHARAGAARTIIALCASRSSGAPVLQSAPPAHHEPADDAGGVFVVHRNIVHRALRHAGVVARCKTFLLPAAHAYGRKSLKSGHPGIGTLLESIPHEHIAPSPSPPHPLEPA